MWRFRFMQLTGGDVVLHGTDSKSMAVPCYCYTLSAEYFNDHALILSFSPSFLLSSMFLPPCSFLCLVLLLAVFPSPSPFNLSSCPLFSLTFNTPLLLCQQKQRCPVLEEQLVDLVVYAMERSESEEHFDVDVGGTSQLLWQHLSSQLIFFVLFQFASFPHMVLSLHQKVCKWRTQMAVV